MGDPPRPRAAPGFFKGHGLGNDYLVFDEGTAWSVSPEAVRAVCDRQRGVGSDGVVVCAPPSGGEHALRMFNPDGSEFERSGNGLRIVAAHLASNGAVGSEPFPVTVGGQTVVMQVHGRGGDGEYDVSVEMGRGSLGPHAVACDPGALDGQGRLLVGARPVRVELVSVGNPHCVVFQEDLSEGALEALGPALSTHAAFANGTNVQLAWPEHEAGVRIRIWERGVGRTTASGTSACAVATAAVARGLVRPGSVDVQMDGGRFEVRVTTDLDIRLRGPVREVCRGTLSPGFVRSLSGA